MAMNLDDHFFQGQDAFTTFAELTGFCVRNAIITPRGKTNLITALEAMGAKRGKMQWSGGKVQDCFRYIGLRNVQLQLDKNFWGKGYKIWET